MIKSIRVSVLVLLLVCSAQAGYMPSGSEEPPPPPPPPASEPLVEEPATDGETSNVLADTLTEAALSVLNNVLALL